ncbi:MAG: SMI1/KNR4 family protein [Pseudomonadota bacterium]
MAIEGSYKDWAHTIEKELDVTLPEEYQEFLEEQEECILDEDFLVYGYDGKIDYYDPRCIIGATKIVRDKENDLDKACIVISHDRNKNDPIILDTKTSRVFRLAGNRKVDTFKSFREWFNFQCLPPDHQSKYAQLMKPSSAVIFEKADIPKIEPIVPTDILLKHELIRATKDQTEVITKAGGGTINAIEKASIESIQVIKIATSDIVESVQKTTEDSVDALRQTGKDTVKTITEAGKTTVDAVNKASTESTKWSRRNLITAVIVGVVGGVISALVATLLNWYFGSPPDKVTTQGQSRKLQESQTAPSSTPQESRKALGKPKPQDSPSSPIVNDSQSKALW